MQDNIEPRPPIRRITRVRHGQPLEWSLLPAALAGGAIGLCGVIGLVVWIGLNGPSQAAGVARPTAIVVTVTPSPVVPTPTPTQASTPLATPEGIYVGGYVQVSGTEGDALRLRSDPGLQTTTLGTAPEGTRLQVLDGPRDADNITWWRLLDPVDGGEGWAAQLYLVPSGAP